MRALFLVSALAGLGLATAVGAPTLARATTIDFDTDGVGDPLAAGTVIDDEYANLGITFQSDDPGNHPLMIFDSSAPTGGDVDLGFINVGNLLIISEDADAGDPDDNAGGGIVDILFDQAVTIDELVFGDLEASQAVTVTAFADLDMTTQLAQVSFDTVGGLDGTDPDAGGGNNQLLGLALGTEGVTKLRLEFSGSGSLAELSFTTTPEPSTALLLVLGLALLAGRTPRPRS